MRTTHTDQCGTGSSTGEDAIGEDDYERMKTGSAMTHTSSLKKHYIKMKYYNGRAALQNAPFSSVPYILSDNENTRLSETVFYYRTET